jgi:hypothetical protein
LSVGESRPKKCRAYEYGSETCFFLLKLYRLPLHMVTRHVLHDHRMRA